MLVSRHERLTPANRLFAILNFPNGQLEALVCNISASGLGVRANVTGPLSAGQKIRDITLVGDAGSWTCGEAHITRLDADADPTHPNCGLAFAQPETSALKALADELMRPAYVTGELLPKKPNPDVTTLNAADYTLASFYRHDSADLLDKCRTFRGWMDDLENKGLFQRLWRTTHTGPLDHKMTIYDPVARLERAVTCFDSNSYLGLHLHPRVVKRTREVLDRVGYGSPSAQLLSGTNRYLRELEEALSAFHGREATIVFPSGFAANTGTIRALVRTQDAVVRDQLAHASIHEGARSAGAKLNATFDHNDAQSLDDKLAAAEEAGCAGKLVATDGLFSMHGALAALPDLVKVTRARGATLLVDEAHALGIFGAKGRGTEEHFDMEGSVDILMGTLSKTLGCVGGYVCGSRDLINYMRFYAPSGMFTTCLPAHLCAGMTEALQVMTEEPEHREQLWENIEYFVPALKQAGFIVSPESPIVTVFVGSHRLLWRMSSELIERGIKAGSVIYPAVPLGESILRFTVNARHTRADLDHAVEALVSIANKYEFLGLDRAEVRALGDNLPV